MSRVVLGVAGRVVASRRNNDPWTCTTYDPRGRVATVALPGLPAGLFGATATTARTVVHSYGVAPAPGQTFNPLVISVSDASGTITTTVDLLGRTVSTNDAYGNPTGAGTADHPTRVSYDHPKAWRLPIVG